MILRLTLMLGLGWLRVFEWLTLSLHDGFFFVSGVRCEGDFAGDWYPADAGESCIEDGMASFVAWAVHEMRGESVFDGCNVAHARYVSMGDLYAVGLDGFGYAMGGRRDDSTGLGWVSDLDERPTARVNASGGR